MANTQIEAMRLALEALEYTTNLSRFLLNDEANIGPMLKADESIESLRQAIREHAMYEVQRLGQEIEQEPVAWMHIMDNTEGIKANGAGIVSITKKRKHPFGKVGIDFSKSYQVTSTPLYTNPPQRTWVGLTIDEREQIQQECFGKVPHHVAFAHAVEAKLKEKNT
jgi:hypothetical protein